jgi:alpha-beta hydrolase superfamily lysophospholipase
MHQRHLFRTLIAAAAVTSVVTSGAPAAVAASDAASTHHTGTLADGATWIADVPASWNGTIILFSHGFGPLTAADAPDPATQADLLGLGYALAGSSYSGSSWWALASAAKDQFASLAAVEKITGRPRRTIAWGESMGGLVSAEETQEAQGRIDGTLTTCGLVAGALSLNNYQLAMRQRTRPALRRRLWQTWRGEPSQPRKAGHAPRWLLHCLTSRPGSAAPRRQLRPTTQRKRNSKLTS